MGIHPIHRPCRGLIFVIRHLQGRIIWMVFMSPFQGRLLYPYRIYVGASPWARLLNPFRVIDALKGQYILA